MRKIDRTGEIGYNEDGLYMEIIAYENNKNIIVRFATGATRKTTYRLFRRGKVYPTWRNIPKAKDEALAEEDIDEVEDNYDKMRCLGGAMAIALALGVIGVGLGVFAGIIYGALQIYKALF